MAYKSCGYRIIPHTSEVGISISGRTWASFYRNAALGLLAIYQPAGRSAAAVKKIKTIRGDTAEETLVAWLNELIFLVGTRRWLPRRIQVLSADDRCVRAEMAGGQMGKRVRVAKEIKSATYSALHVENRSGWIAARIILDV